MVILVPTNKTELLREAAADAATGNALQGLAKEASLRKPNKKETATEEGNEKDVTINKAAGHDLRELAKETRLENVTPNIPCQGNQRPKKEKSRKVGSY